MKIVLLALTGTAVALTAVPADARHYSNTMTCTKWRHGKCVTYKRLTRAQERKYNVGYVFAPTYDFTALTAIPHPYVERYHLGPDERYVYSGNTIYVVDPTSRAVTKVIEVTP
jgi:hypothetical protein